MIVEQEGKKTIYKPAPVKKAKPVIKPESTKKEEVNGGEK